MATLKRYSSFKEMEEAQMRDQAMRYGKKPKVKKQNTIEAFASSLRKSVVNFAKQKRNTKRK